MTPDENLKIVVLASGSGTNLQAILDCIEAQELDVKILAVISDVTDAYALERATRANIKTIVVNFADYTDRAEFDSALELVLQELNPELIVLAGYMRILASTTVNLFRGKMLNVHPSLLPAYPGLHTYQRVLAAGDKWHGTTVHFVIPELDAGPPIIQYRVPVRPGETEPTLKDRVQSGEYEIYPQAIQWFAEGRLRLEDNCAILDGNRLKTPVIVDEKCPAS